MVIEKYFRHCFDNKEHKYHDLIYVNENSLWYEGNIVAIALGILNLKHDRINIRQNIVEYSKRFINDHIYVMDEATSVEVVKQIYDGMFINNVDLVDKMIDEVIEEYDLQFLYAKASLVNPKKASDIIHKNLFNFNNVIQSVHVERQLEDTISCL